MVLSVLFRLRWAWISFLILTFAACASTASKTEMPPPIMMEPYFPPHEVIRDGLYSAFLMKNQEALIECQEASQCAVYLFNLGFVYSYSKSPYFNQEKGVYYFRVLMDKYPESSFASLARIWTDLLNRCIAAEQTKHQLKGKLKSKEVTIRELQKKVEEKDEQLGEKNGEEKAESVEKKAEEEHRAREVEAEIDRMEREVRRKLEQSRAIDAEIERKERELTR